MKVYVVSLGCDKNLVDTEKMLGIIQEAGHEITFDESEAEAVIVNTCCFIGDAKEESISVLLEMAELKKNGHLKKVIACGCLAQRYKDEIKKEIPEVDVCIGTMSGEYIAKALDDGQDRYDELSKYPFDRARRALTTGGHYAYLKIAEGCNKRCTYCIIPYLRGSYRSVKMEDVISDAEYLAKEGVREVILVAQEICGYGTDIYGKKALPELLEKLSAIEGIEWIRLLYAYPEEIDDSIIDAMARLPKVCHYIDMPIQHISDDILRRMGRGVTSADIKGKIQKIRDRIPDICIRTTLISGFPGETQEEFEELYRFVNETEFDRLGVFAYSPEEGTPASEFPDQIPDDIKISRRDEIMELQDAVAADKAEKILGKTLKVLGEGREDEDMLPFDDGRIGTDLYVGRSYMDAPGVDGFVYFRSDREIMTGELLDIEIEEAAGYDLYGKIKQ